jgi:putative SOS response-associated peptidase YedK
MACGCNAFRNQKGLSMCARYDPPAPAALAQFNLPPPDFAYRECFPARVGPFLPNQYRDRWKPGCFGLVPHWADIGLARRTYNARSETVARLPSFRHAWNHRQLAVIPVQRFYEPRYESGKAQWWAIERTDGKACGLAGIWEHRFAASDVTRWSYSMLTINAAEHPLMKQFHRPRDEKRSIVVLDDDEWDAWLGSRGESDLRSFLRPFDADTMVASPQEQMGAFQSRRRAE